MPILSDFVRITTHGDHDVEIGDDKPGEDNNETGFTATFGTGGRYAPYSAYIIFMLKGMTEANDDAGVFVNDNRVGTLKRYNGGDPEHWQTQIVDFNGNFLNNGNNTLRVNPVPNLPGLPRNKGNFNNFYIRNVICHFHQDT